MTEPPVGALRRLEEVRDLVFKAKVEGETYTLYLVDGNYPVQPSMVKHQLTEKASLVGNTLFLNLASKKENDFNYHDNILLPSYGVGSSGRNRLRCIFTNYFHAWGYFQRLKQRYSSDQQKGYSEFLEPRAGQFHVAQGAITGRLK